MELAASGGVGDEHFVGQGSHKFVTAGGKVGGDAGFLVGEEGEDQEAAVGQWLSPFGRDTSGDPPGGADDDGLGAAQQNAKTLLLHRRMEAADDAAPGVAPLGGLIVGGEDDAAGTTGGAEQRRHGLGQEVQVAEGSQFRRGVGAQTLAQAGRITGIATQDYLVLPVHGWFALAFRARWKLNRSFLRGLEPLLLPALDFLDAFGHRQVLRHRAAQLVDGFAHLAHLAHPNRCRPFR